MRRPLAVLVAVGVALAAPPAALAYSAPSGAGTNTTVCPPRPADASSSADEATTDLATIAQELADQCQLLKQIGDQAHSDSAALDGDLTAFGKANHSDLAQLDQDVNAAATQAHQDATSGGGSGQAVQVTNWPADQQVGFDSASSGQLDGIGQSTHGDLWVLIGVIVACFAFTEFLRKVWP